MQVHQAFDDCNTRMVLQGPPSLGAPDREATPRRARRISMLKRVLASSPRLTELCVAQRNKGSPGD